MNKIKDILHEKKKQQKTISGSSSKWENKVCSVYKIHISPP